MVLWVFGYGSLIWNPGFQFDEKIIGYIKDYERVFDLACIDHRGTAEYPARTCMLQEQKGAICWGAAYCVRGGLEKEKAAMEYLERRECEYDGKAFVDVFLEGDDLNPSKSGVMIFTSSLDSKSNKYYLGPAPMPEMARQIATASGPFGNNRDYLFLLEKALFTIGHEEEFIIKLATEVRKVIAATNGAVGVGLTKDRKSSVVPYNISTLQSHSFTHTSFAPLAEPILATVDS